MKVGDLVKHRQTKVTGILLDILDDASIPAPTVYDVYWSDIYNCVESSHFLEEIEVVSEGI